ncbi:methyl-accepting chemotaxis protein [Stutzerimonas balearica]|jgi:methyl-accepting chemotaxis protein|uniref:methyl-accepting chemotaxis protein n=1 Tax=Stutzerimonas balearica TaxID=74829 RepID=UPI0007730A05|nr:methyl-accepting chemotaxis protein [Stutzerimonas balearica]MBK3749173.1 HAMP domain-containing protein [Stutzerimonas balearica]MBK3827370.1 HAMP domain-containing protein [Stutzerimonas balearica]MBK3857060.1 HAMP domain-containing protein [Stutzerimonas balearica]OMG62399.1 methyl-accepting chemotaxis protein [Stutzerimonas balearica]
MKLLFRPAEALMNRFNYPVKFGLLGLLVFVAFASLMLTVVGQLQRTIERSAEELQATALARPVFRLVELTQQHRGLSAMLLGGNPAVTAKRAERESDVEAALAELSGALPAARQQLPSWQAIRQGWGEIRRDGLGWTQARNMRAHTELIQSMLRFNTELADAYGLTFDPEAESYYLMAAALDEVPYLIERIGRLRGSASAALAHGSMGDEQRVGLILLSEEIRGAMSAMQISLDKVIAQRPDLRGTLEAASTRLREQAAGLDEVVQGMVQRGDFARVSSERFFAMASEAIGIGYQQIRETLLPSLDSLLNQRIAKAQRVLMLNVAVSLLALLLIGYLSAGAYFSVMTSVRRLREGSGRLAAGDLTARIELDTRDELRQVAASFNEMAAAMRGLIGSIRDNSDHVADSARSLVTASGQIHVATQCQSDAASSMAAAVEQMTVGIEHIARNAGEADSLAHRSGELSRQGGEIVAAVVEEIRQIAASVSESAHTVAELGERSGQISAIVQVIGDIAAQTNLLALNAAIEAARAGEQGRGFAVVADEVRKLAERTAQSTREIGEMVAAIQQGTSGAVQGMEQGVTRVNEGVVRAQRAGEAMHGIREAANQVQGTVAEISHALREQSAASAEIAQKVSMIAQMAEENGSAVGSNHQTASRLSDLAGTLLDNVSRFKAG